MDALERWERAGYIVKLYADDSPDSPREWDNVCSLTELRDHVQQCTGPDDGDADVIRAWQHMTWARGQYRHSTELVERYARAFLDAAAVGWWDDPRGGSRVFGYITRATAEREHITDPAGAVRAELTDYAQWCNGEVYGYVIETPEGEHVDSLWGLYDWDYAVSEANATADSERDAADRAERDALERAELDAAYRMAAGL